MGRFEIIWGRICLSIFLTIFLLSIVEFTSRKYRIGRSTFERNFPVEIYRHPRPYIMFSGLARAEGLNSHGYKGPYPDLPKPRNELRILFLGGSALVEGNPTICELVQAELRSTFSATNVCTYNLGVVSSISGMELAKLVFEACDLQPDVVVVYNGANDIHHPLNWDPRPGYPFNFIVYENNPILESDVHLYPTLPLLAYGSNLLRYFFPDYFAKAFIPMENIRQAVNYGSEQWRQQIASNYIANMKKSNLISKSFGADFVVFFQPTVFWKSQLALNERSFCNPSAQAHAVAVRAMILHSTDITCNTRPLNFIDLSTIYNSNSTACFTDCIHTRQEAKVVVAKAIAEGLIPSVKNHIKSGSIQ